MKTILKYRKSILLFAVFLFIIVLSKWRFTLFDAPYSAIAIADNGELIGACIANDGQWRFPSTSAPDSKYVESLIAFEDHSFYGHNGVYLPSIVRALKQNWQNNRIVSGGSTITMQLARMARGNPPRTWLEKLIETALAWQIEQFV